MNFDPIARAYRWLEFASFGRALQRRREAFLPQLTGARRVLMLGDGDGRFLEAFLRRNPAAAIESVDSSARMLALARARAKRATDVTFLEHPVRFHQADALAWEPPAAARYDLVVTHFFLDCFADEEVARIVPRLTAATAPAARWLLSEFRAPARGVAAWRARFWIGCLYRAFGLVTGLRVRRLPNYREHLQANGFVLEREEIAEWGLLTSELWRRSAQPEAWP